VVSVNTGMSDSVFSDFTSGFVGDANLEIERVCNLLKDHPDLKGAEGINMVGFSQGGQFARAVVQRCR
jgi:palmitoyl-protein thioesterase